ncbi:MAG: hypothetical protein FWF81_14805 [Defluviitaleaceae bacterium]|nr:hypothetical protein [Defluviitaleaceae bacterium]
MLDPYLYDDWAGQPRTIPIEKQEAVLAYMSIEYAKPQEIVAASAIFHDADFRKPEYLIRIMTDSLEQGINNL